MFVENDKRDVIQLLDSLNSLELENAELIEPYEMQVIYENPIIPISELYDNAVYDTNTGEIMSVTVFAQATYNLAEDITCTIKIIDNKTKENSGYIVSNFTEEYLNSKYCFL